MLYSLIHYSLYANLLAQCSSGCFFWFALCLETWLACIRNSWPCPCGTFSFRTDLPRPRSSMQLSPMSTLDHHYLCADSRGQCPLLRLSSLLNGFATTFSQPVRLCGDPCRWFTSVGQIIFPIAVIRVALKLLAPRFIVGHLQLLYMWESLSGAFHPRLGSPLVVDDVRTCRLCFPQLPLLGAFLSGFGLAAFGRIP